MTLEGLQLLAYKAIIIDNYFDFNSSLSEFRKKGLRKFSINICNHQEPKSFLKIKLF